MRFFVPGTGTDEDAESVWEATRRFAEKTVAGPVSDRRIFRLDYEHNGREYVAEVGKTEPRTREPVHVILESRMFLVCTPTRGVARGEPILVGKEEVRRVIDFAPTQDPSEGPGEG